MSPDDLPDRLAAKIEIQPSGCWKWTAFTNDKGYGTVRMAYKTVYAHRLVYHLLVDRSLPLHPGKRGGDLDHLCRYTSCVNPTHLEPVTRQENVRRYFATYDVGRHILDVLEEADRPLRSGEVARALGLGQSGAAHQLRRLLERGRVRVVGFASPPGGGRSARLYVVADEFRRAA